jgi:hypothetical protein
MFKTNLTDSQTAFLADKLTQKFNDENWPVEFESIDQAIITDCEPMDEVEIKNYIEAFEAGAEMMEPALNEIQEHAEIITKKINQI